MNPYRKFIFNLGLNSLEKETPEQRVEAIMQRIRSMVQKDNPEKALRFLFELDRHLYVLEGQTSIRYGNGIHTKHRHIHYHEFFIKHVTPRKRVLDIGSGNGLLAYKIVTETHAEKVVGIDKSPSSIDASMKNYHHPHLKFILGEVPQFIPNESFDVITLSNFLEHIENRVEFLINIVKKVEAKRLVIRVPLFDRDWRVPLKKELGLDYRLDSTHCIEYLPEVFSEEMDRSGLLIKHWEVRWGEIWSVVEPTLKVKE